MNYLPVSSPRR